MKEQTYAVGEVYMNNTRIIDHVKTSDPVFALAMNVATQAHHLRRNGKIIAAEALGRHALSLTPNNIWAMNQLGGVLIGAGKYKEAEELYIKAMSLAQTEKEKNVLRHNYALAIQSQGRFDETLSIFSEMPQSPFVDWEIFNTLVMAGRLDEAWPYGESRRTLNTEDYRVFLPDWDGKTDGHLLVTCEQGAGDIIQFARFLPWARTKVSKITLATPIPFLGLMNEYPGVDEIVPGMDGCRLPKADFWCPLMSLPMHRVASGEPGLPPDPDAFRERTKQFAINTGFTVKVPPGMLSVGIVWAGNKKHERDWQRSMNLKDMLPILSVPGIAISSLQIGRDGEIESEGVGSMIHDCTKALSAGVTYAPGMASWVKTAAAIMGMDLIITVDTGVSHLACALRKPTWVLMPDVPDWRWPFRGSKTPWYPTARLFRQKNANDWSGVIQKVVSELQKIAPRPLQESSQASHQAPLA